MKNILHVAAAAVLACALVACSSSGIEEENPQINGGNNGSGNGSTECLLVSASVGDEIPQPAGLDTRVGAEDDGTSKIVFSWKLQDKIYVRSGYACKPFTAIKVDAQNPKSAIFQSPEGYNSTPDHAIWTGSKEFSGYYVTAIPGLKSTVCTTMEELADRFWMSSIYDAVKKNFVFRPMYSILRFDITLPAGQTAINSFRIQMQDGTKAFIVTPTVVISRATIEYANKETATYDFEQTGLNIPLVNGHVVLYLPIAIDQTTTIAGKKMEIIINETLYATQTCGALAIGKTAPIKKTAEKWLSAPYTSGLGTPEVPYLVSNETNLRGMAMSVNGTDGFTKNNYNGKTFVQTKSIILNGTSWTAIGATTTSRFYGDFDGQRKGMKFPAGFTFTDTGAPGLFGYTNGTISNIIIIGNASYSGVNASYVGTIVGVCSSPGKIVNCAHSGSLTATRTGGTSIFYVGGIAGAAFSMVGCSETGNSTISSTASGVTQGTGGIVGYALASTIHDCTVISGKKIVASAGAAGAISGFASVLNCNTFASDVTVTVAGTAQNPIVPAPSGYTLCGDGTEALPYIIGTEDDLWKLAAQVNGLTYNGTKYTATSYSGKYFKMAADITINSSASKPWTPIGTTSTPFAGNFDGGSRTISGTVFTKYTPSTTTLYEVGIFGLVQNNTIRNVFVSATVQGDITQSSYIGGIIGDCKTTNIVNCMFTGKIEASGNGTIVLIGGIVGYLESNSNMVQCVLRNAVIISTAKAFSPDRQRVGGILGTLQSGGNVHACKAEGSTFTLNNGVITHIGAIGGIVTAGTPPTVVNSVYTCCTASGNTCTLNGVGQTLSLLGSSSTAMVSAPGHTEPTL